MRAIAVVGSASGAGKTAVACAILRAVPGLGAVKISPREAAARVEWGGGPAGKDTARYAASGAVAVARIVSPRGRAQEAWGAVRAVFERLPAIVIEGAGALDLPVERFTVFVADPRTLGARPARDERLAAAADCIVVVRPRGAVGGAEHPLLARHQGRGLVPPVFVADGDWDHPALIDAVRSFLSGSTASRSEPAGG